MASTDLRAELEQVLCAAFQQTAQMRRYGLIVIDNRSDKDRGADRRLYSWFCQMFAEVVDPTTVRVSLRGNVPIGPAVREWLRSQKLPETSETLVFEVQPSDVQKLRSLSAAIRSIVRRGARYEVSSYKYVCPRVARSLDQLHSTLRTYWRRLGSLPPKR
jgi:hypothetical protein